MPWWCPDCGKGGQNVRGPAGHYCPAIGGFSPGKPSGPKPPKPCDDAPTEGPGTELEKILKGFQIRKLAKCQCEQIKCRMNEAGPDGCEERLDVFAGEILAEARRRSWWFSGTRLADATARMLIGRAIRNSREAS